MYLLLALVVCVYKYMFVYVCVCWNVWVSLNCSLWKLSYVMQAPLYTQENQNLLARGHDEFSLCWIFLFWIILLPSSHVFLMNLKILGYSFSCLSWLLSFKVAQKKKGEGQVSLMKRGRKLKPEQRRFSNVKVQCRRLCVPGHGVLLGDWESPGGMNSSFSSALNN